MSIAALILGVLSIIISFLPCFNIFALLGGIIAIIFASVGLSQAKTENAPTSLAVISLFVGIIAVVISILFLFVGGLLMALLLMWN
ncbi:hypothetical protein KHA90_08455 [Flavobacterium psychroterrae]|uniref:DUF4190 domain-containing protein n=1 Tax=Flavobacterium psychroterrae TaxID=2133767 RepID=A0ABS5P9U8_9FLAO|nr:hypothetical protein [Flavobacterium psychroterrae]MBS7231054.1 hypothetical protein [Flavobacterium psychroterrae]